MPELRFNDSVWVNIDIALSQINAIYQREIEPLGLTVLEGYILQTLYEEDGQMASRLAYAVGRAATSFTPILDKLESKGFVERKAHTADRRAVRIYVTQQGRAIEAQLKETTVRIESRLRAQFKDKDWQGYETVITYLQRMNP